MNISVSNPKSSGKSKTKSVKQTRIVVSPKARNNATRPQPTKLKGIGPNLTQEYYDSLTDPFEHQGCKLGWGCMSPSQIQSAYVRLTTAANADGTAAFVACPNAKGILSYYLSGAAVARTAQADATDLAAISASFGSGRCVSIGIKAFPSIAATSAPGVCYSGALDGMTDTILSALVPNDFVAFPNSRQDIASLGCSATGRPIDTDSFAFANAQVDGTGYTTTAKIPFSLPFVAFTGLPASASIALEVVFNFEGLYLTKHLSTGMGSGSFGDNLANYWPNFETMYGKIRPYLPSPGQAFDYVASKVSVPSVHSMFGRLMSASPALPIGNSRNGQLALPWYGRS